MLSIIGFIITLVVIVFIHEYGHYFAAKKCGVKVEEFSIGFGKELWHKIDKSGTRWKICLIPLGGFAKMYGDLNAASMPDTKSVRNFSEADKKMTFLAQSLPKRAFIIAAGPLANFLLSIVILTGFYFSFGKYDVKPIITSVVSGSPAEQAGLKAGDEVIEADSIGVKQFTELKQIIASHPSHKIKLLVKRAEEALIIDVTPSTGEDKSGYIGITAPPPRGDRVSLSIVSSLVQASDDVVMISRLFLDALGEILVGSRSLDNELGGMIRIAQESGKSLENGLGYLLLFIAFLSVNVGLINLMPVPLLDGGHLLFMCYEAAFGKPINHKVQNVFYRFGFSIIIFLVVFSISNDIKSLLF